MHSCKLLIDIVRQFVAWDLMEFNKYDSVNMIWSATYMMTDENYES